MATGINTLRDGIENASQPLPPGHNIPSLDHETAPVDSDGSFLVHDRMPTDEVTGLPYAILPKDFTYAAELDGAVNYHHHFYNRRHPDLEGEYRLSAEQLANPEDIPFPVIAGFAVRISRGQRLPMTLHQLAHRRFPIGPILPHTIDEKFITAVKACSGVVSRMALDVTAPEGKQLIRMNDETFMKVASPKLLCTERVFYDKPANHRRRILGNFFLRYAVRQDLSHVSERQIDEFLHTDNAAARLAVGHAILREAMEVGLAPVIPMVRELKAQGMVQPGRPDVSTAVWKYVHPNRRERVFRVLRKQLIA